MKTVVVNSVLFFIDNLLKTLMIAGAVLITGLIIAHPKSWAINGAMIALVGGFLSFAVASQFLVTIEMDDSETLAISDKAKDIRLAIPFLCGYFAYIAAGCLICVHFIVS